MITPYKKIAIIYGGSGYTCATAIEKEINRLHTKEFYPIKPCILAKHIMSGSSIIETVQRLISESSACIGILTFDDCDNSRVRQNVLIELGMALMMIDKNQCFYLSDRVPLPEDFPSDLKGLVNPNLFDKESPELVAQEMGEEIRKSLRLKSVRGVLRDDYYLYNYRKILDDIPNEIFEEKYDRQLEHILSSWEKTVESLDYCAERLMYILERVNFFANFTLNDGFFRFLDHMEELCRPQEEDFDMYPPDFLIPLSNFTCCILRYLRAKYLPVYTGQKDTYHQRITLQQLKALENELDEFVRIMDEKGYNWYIRTMALDYLALAAMKADQYSRQLSVGASKPLTIDPNKKLTPDTVKKLTPDAAKIDTSTYDRIITFFTRALAEVKAHDAYSRDLWGGYLNYNLARAHENLYTRTNNPEHLEALTACLDQAITSRREWLRQRDLTGAFESALSYEYFLACKYRAEVHYRHAADLDQELPHILDSLREIKTELRHYSQDTQYGRLNEIRDAIDDLWKLWDVQ